MAASVNEEETTLPALKDMFDEARFRQIAATVAAIYPDFAPERFLALALPGLASLTLIQRMRCMSKAHYAVHYVKKSGGSTRKVFKLKELTLEPEQAVTLLRQQSIRNFTTRVHYPGRHVVEVMVNGEMVARDAFELLPY